MRRAFKRVASVLIAGALGTAVLPADANEAKRTGDEALEYAFKFGSAIYKDPKDRAKSMQQVAIDTADRGQFGPAIQRARAINGWRRADALAQIATRAADAGQVDRAKRLVDQAKSEATSVEGWPQQRVASHIAEALGRIGSVDEADRMSSAIAEVDPRQYEGKAAAIVAAGEANDGDFDAAMQELQQLKVENSYDALWWRTVGFIEIAKRSTLSAEQRASALSAAVSAAEAIPGWKQAEALMSISDQLLDLGDKTQAAELLGRCEGMVLPMPETSSVRVHMLALLAERLIKVDRKKRAVELLLDAEQHVQKVLLIDRPLMYGVLGGVHAIADRSEEAWRLFDLAFLEAEGLVNARPRALAVVGVCRQMGLREIALNDKTRQRLDALYAGLKDPW